MKPVKYDPLAGVAVRVTRVPASKGALQVLPQAMPTGLEVTVPVPVPALARVSREAFPVPSPASYTAYNPWPFCVTRTA